MATRVSSTSPAPIPMHLGAEVAISSETVVEIAVAESRTVVIITDGPNESIFRIVADITGKPWRKAESLAEIEEEEGVIVGIEGDHARPGLKSRSDQMIVINTYCLDKNTFPDSSLTDACDYEFLYLESPYFRRDLTRFLTHVLGQTDFHEQLIKKGRTNLISTTFPNVKTALSNLDILTVGADAVELRVDLLKEAHPDGTFSSIPSLKYVGEQVMLLRQRSELPLIYTCRCTRENGKFPMHDPDVTYQYLRRAIQWGVEYIDVELWLPEEIRDRLKETKGYSRIISAFHDFTGEFKWTSDEAYHLFREAAKFADIVKMIKVINSMAENYQLEVFRTNIRAKYPHPPLSAVNMGQLGQLSRALNCVFSPITHPLLPVIAAPGQMSAAEINTAMHVMGQLPRQDIYAIGNFRSTAQSVFFEKCFNELGLPHHFACVSRAPRETAEAFVTQPNFGGACLYPPMSSVQPYIPSLTDAAQRIGQIDTIVARQEGEQRILLGDNATWKGIRATLTRDFLPSAYFGRAALILSNSESEAAPAIFALKSLGIGKIYTVGFKGQGPLASGLEPFTSIDTLKRVEQPFVIISALPPEKSTLVQPLLRHYSGYGNGNTSSRVFVDLAYGPRKGDPIAVAETSGWSAYGMADVSAWQTVETLRLLVGQNVPFEFVRMASGRGLY